MARFVKGDIVVLPFSDLSGNKRRPAFVMANLPGNDIIQCQITSRYRKDKYAIELNPIDFAQGGLPALSYVRPNRVFTADKNIILRKAGSLKQTVSRRITDQLISILES